VTHASHVRLGTGVAESVETEGVPPRVSVIVPVTERPSPLDRTYREFASALEGIGVTFEFLFLVEPWGGYLLSTLDELIQAGKPIRVFELGRAMGESPMLRAAAERARGQLLVTVPAYPRIEASELPALLEAVDQGVDLAVARRGPEGRSRLNRLQSRIFHGILRLAVGGSFHDVASGVRVMRREVLEEVPLYGDFYRFLPILAEKEGFRVREVTVTPHSEEARARIYSPGIYLRRLIDIIAVAFVVRFTRKPLRFFGLMGAAAAAVGAAILLVLFVQRVGGQGIADRPMLLLGVLCFILGIQAIAIGLVGEIIVHLSASGGRQYRVRSVGAPPSPGTSHPGRAVPDPSRTPSDRVRSPDGARRA
jgi:hypothetical protein